MPSDSAKPSPAPRRVAFLVFDGTKLLDLAGPLQVFADARSPQGGSAYQTGVISETGGLLTTDTSCRINTVSVRNTDPAQWDTVLVSGGDRAYRAMHAAALLSWLKTAAATARRLGSICLGAFVLAAGGHLRGRRATTHWEGCAALATRFPDTVVEDDAIFVEDDGVWTSAGVTAGIDMALEMVSRDLGAAEALRIAKSLVLPVHRGGGQRQFSEALAAQEASKSTRFAELIRIVASTLHDRHTVADMASRTGMSERNFSRQFTAELGVSPAHYIERLRVDRAASLLHRRNVSLAAAQRDAGFTNAEQMRRAFHRCLGVSPSAYARTFAS